MKINSFEKNCISALILQFILIPIMALITYKVYDSFSYLGVVQDSYTVFVFSVIGIVIVNFLVIYGISYLYNKYLKFENVFHIITGLVAIFMCIWFKVYIYVSKLNVCENNSSEDCLDLISKNQLINTALILLIMYYLIFIIMLKMLNKRLKK